MQLNILKAKILRATTTDAQRDYEGSLAIDSSFMEKINLLPYEKILVGNITNGERFETYAIPAPAGSLTFSLNGAAAHKGSVGDLLVIMAFAQMDEQEALHWQPKVLVLGDGNKKILRHDT
jgi:aspartate 1-decarboxylase